MAEFVDTYSRIAIPEHLPYLFLVAGGALAVENALKTALDWKVRKNMARGISGERGHKVIHFEQAFHGRSGYTLSTWGGNLVDMVRSTLRQSPGLCFRDLPGDFHLQPFNVKITQSA